MSPCTDTMTGFLVALVLLSALLGARCESHYGAMFQSLGKLGTEHDNKNLFSHMTELSMAEVSGTISEAIKKVVDDDLLSTENISATCLHHLSMTWKAVTLEDWANTMVDASGKISPGLFLGNTFWTGQYDECVEVTAKVKVTNTSATTDMFTGRYCTIGIPALDPMIGLPHMHNIPRGDIAIGLCVPNSCNAQDIQIAINKVISLLPYNWTHSGNMATLYARDGVCQMETLEYDTRAVFAITLLCIIGAVIIAGTLYDMFAIHKLHRDIIIMVEPDADDTSPLNDTPNQEMDSLATRYRGYGSTGRPITVHTDLNSPSIQEAQDTGSYSIGLCGRLLQSFSIYTNGPKLLDTRKQADKLGAIHGIRFISLSWVILGHTYLYLESSQNTLPFGKDHLNQLSFMVIINGTVSVDTFFLLSGLLVSYLSLREMRKVEGVKNFRWAMFYFHRFWRLTPPYMLVILLYVPLSKYWYNGPFWRQEGIEENYCADTWWRNLLYINNFFPTLDMCMGWSWYLSNDMQFYVISPIFLISLYYSHIIGGLVSGIALLASWIISGLISKHYNLNLTIILNNDINMYFEKYYQMPYCRIGPYIIGMLCGYILYRTDLKMRLSRKVQCVGWMVAAGCCLSVLYANFDAVNGKNPNSVEVMALYNALARSAWAVGVAWVIFASAIGYGGWVNRFLSWSVFIPLSRLTYMAYLIHPAIMELFNTGKRQLMYLTDVEMSYLFLGHMCISYALAFVLSMAFESPFMALEKALFNKGKRRN